MGTDEDRDEYYTDNDKRIWLKRRHSDFGDDDNGDGGDNYNETIMMMLTMTK